MFNYVALDDYYNHFRNDLEDPSYILELEPGFRKSFNRQIQGAYSLKFRLPEAAESRRVHYADIM